MLFAAVPTVIMFVGVFVLCFFVFLQDKCQALKSDDHPEEKLSFFNLVIFGSLILISEFLHLVLFSRYLTQLTILFAQRLLGYQLLWC